MNVPAAVHIQNLWISLRPAQWIKNTLVFAGLIFSLSLFHWEALWLCLRGFLLFCMASSSVYLLNDLWDLEEDKRHPHKRFRPLAAGELAPSAARVLIIGLSVAALLGGFSLSRPFGLVLVCYLLLNLSYTVLLKHIALLDILAVAASFVLRAVAGAWLIGVQVSVWLVLCTLSLGLFLSLGKRRHELETLNSEAFRHRRSLKNYTPRALDALVCMLGGLTLVLYTIYAAAPDTVNRFGGSGLLFTVPLIVFGLTRYFHLARRNQNVGDPARLLLKDRPLLINAVLWVVAVCLIIYA